MHNKVIITSQQLQDYEHEIGSKTRNLARLMEIGLPVPAFVAIPASVAGKIFSGDGVVDKSVLDRLVVEIQEQLCVRSYAVRSSALIEDTEKSSFAGQFRTEIDQSGDCLAQAIISVLQQASTVLGSYMEHFSLVVQEYIPARYAGVCFTRNPLGGREMLIEYHAGIGEDVVGGKIKPMRKSFYWNQLEAQIDLSGFDKVFGIFKRIEILFGQPQDIEWCIDAHGKWYFLQSRPITTLTVHDYQECLFLDDNVPKSGNFFFEKTEISEIAPRPTPFAFSLFEGIYGQDGPVSSVYSRYGVRYKSQPFLKVVGNELYVDREKEIHTLLPAYSYFPDFKPHWNSIRGFPRTLRNIFALNRVSLGRYDELVLLLKEKLVCPWKKMSFQEMVSQFMREYEIIFEINLLAEKALKRLEYLLKNKRNELPALLSFSHKLGFDFDSTGWNGNSLEIADESEFMRLQSVDDDASSESMSPFLKPYIEEAQKYSALREYGRYLTVKNVSWLRRTVLEQAQKMLFDDQRLLYFASIPEIENRAVSEDVCRQRKKEYEAYSRFRFPSRLTSSPVVFESVLLAVSKGKANGRLVDVETLSDSDDQILYTQSLTPDLTRYFDKISGIISENGGLLSHLAIMAREKGIPVVVNFNLARSGIRLGDVVVVEAQGEEVRVIRK